MKEILPASLTDIVSTISIIPKTNVYRLEFQIK